MKDLSKYEQQVLAEAESILKEKAGTNVEKIIGAVQKLKKWEPSVSESEYEFILDFLETAGGQKSFNYSNDLREIQRIVDELLEIDDLSPFQMDELREIRTVLKTVESQKKKPVSKTQHASKGQPKIEKMKEALRRLDRWEPSMSREEHSLIWDVHDSLRQRLLDGDGYDRDLKQVQGIVNRLLKIEDLSPSEIKELEGISSALWTGVA